MKRTQRSGFSLIELVIVIVILAVISAIALPRISRGAKGAEEAALGQNLAILRGAIEMYAAEHSGDYPGENAAGGTFGDAGSSDAFENQLTLFTDKTGQVSETKTGNFIYGPYLLRIPPLTVGANAGDNTVEVVTAGDATVGGTTGWVFSTETGRIIANCGDDDDAGDRTYDEW